MIQSIRKLDVLSDAIERCNQLVVESLRRQPVTEAEIAVESFLHGGKRLRPALMICSASVPGANGIIHDTPLLQLAGAVELIHLATLFHDDVIDDVDLRRSEDSARLKYGNYRSVLTGDFALTEALDLVRESGLDVAMPEFIRTLRVLVRGESLETTHKFDFDLTEARYYEIISEKSASLFALACKVGAASQGSTHADPLGHFGWSLGMAFQMIDDLDDMVATPNGSRDCDLVNGYFALPIIRLLASLSPTDREAFVRFVRDGDFSGDNERRVVEMCMEHGTIGQTRDEIKKHLDRAGETLGRFDDGEAKELLSLVVTDLGFYADRQVENYRSYLHS